MSAPHVWVVVPAAGSGQRMAAETPKQYLPLAGRSMLDWTLNQLLLVPEVQRVVVAVSPGDQQFARQTFAGSPRVRRVRGGDSRAESVLAGLADLADQAHPDDVVLVHDAARPLISADDIAAVIAAALQWPDDGVILATPVADTLKSCDPTAANNAHPQVTATVARDGLWQAQTPQAARFGPLHAAMTAAVRMAEAGGVAVTDEAGALQQFGITVRVVPAGQPNLKVTTRQDLALADAVLARRLRNA